MARIYRNDCSGLGIDGIVDLLLIKYLKLYKFRFMTLDTELAQRIESYDHIYHQGFKILYGQLEYEDLIFENITGSEDLHEEWGNLFLETIDILENNQIKYLVVNNPLYFRNKTHPFITDLFNQLPSKNYLNLNGNETFLNNTLFFDKNHLNYYGSQIYTQFVYEKLNGYII